MTPATCRTGRRPSATPFMLAAAAAALLAAPEASAQSAIRLYGLLDISAGSFQAAGGAKNKRVESGNMSTSYFGVSGTEDLGGGLGAVFALESFLRADTGQSGRVAVDVPPRSDVFWARNANVGLHSAAWGTVRMGRMGTTMFLSTLLFNPFGDSFGFSPSIRHYYTSALLGDSGWSDAVRYDSPKFGGLSFAVQGNFDDGGPKAAGRNVGGHVLYFSGKFAATAAWQRVRNDQDLRFSTALPAGFDDQTAVVRQHLCGGGEAHVLRARDPRRPRHLRRPHAGGRAANAAVPPRSARARRAGSIRSRGTHHGGGVTCVGRRGQGCGCLHKESARATLRWFCMRVFARARLRAGGRWGLRFAGLRLPCAARSGGHAAELAAFAPLQARPPPRKRQSNHPRPSA